MTKRTLAIELEKAQAEAVERRVASGDYESPAHVLEAAFEALAREEAALNEMMRQRIQEAFDDPRPSIPADEVFREIWAEHARRWGLKPDAA